LFKRYSIAAAFLNMYPFAAFVFFKLCIFLIFTAFDLRFNSFWNKMYGLYYVLILCVLLTKPHSNGEYFIGRGLRIKNILKWMRPVAGKWKDRIITTYSCLMIAYIT
jgi:hypothetical protein